MNKINIHSWYYEKEFGGNSKKLKQNKKLYKNIITIDFLNDIEPMRTKKALGITVFWLNVVPITASVGCDIASTTKLANKILEKK